MCYGGGQKITTYVADDITYQNLNGQQLAIKIYTLLPDQNPDDLVEDDFDYDGYHYRITLITCVKNQPSLRLCVQAVEIR